MVLAPIPLNHSFAAVRRDSKSAPAHWGDAKIEFLTVCSQQHGGKKRMLAFSTGSGMGNTGLGTQLPRVFCCLPYFRSFLLSRCRAFKDCVPYLGLSRLPTCFPVCVSGTHKSVFSAQVSSPLRRDCQRQALMSLGGYKGETRENLLQILISIILPWLPRLSVLNLNSLTSKSVESLTLGICLQTDFKF